MLDAKMGWGDGLRDLVRRMTSGRYKGRHEGGGARRRISRFLLEIDVNFPFVNI